MLGGGGRTKTVIPRGLDMEDAKKLIEAPNIRYVTGLRNRLMMELMLRCGMRVSEVCNLKMTHLKRNDNWRLIIKDGKTGDRDLWVPMSLRPMMEIWLQKRSDKLPKCEWLFPTHAGTPCSRSYIYGMMTRMAKRAGIAKTHPHALRHTFAHNLLKETGNVALLQRTLGHSTPSMSLRYAMAHNKDVEKYMSQI